MALEEPLSVERCGRSLLKGVYRLEPGHFILLKRNGRVKQIRWWCTAEHFETLPESFERQTTLFRERFKAACALRMRSDVPLGTALSGGLDSSSVLGMMCHIAEQGTLPRLQRNWQTSFVAAYRNTPVDETPFARQVISHINGRGVFVPIDTPISSDEVDRILYHLEDIYYDIPIGLWKLYKTMAEYGIRVTLDGHGGDELLCGYPHHVILAMADAMIPRYKFLTLGSHFLTFWRMHTVRRLSMLPKLEYIRKKPKIPEYNDIFPDWDTDKHHLSHFGHMERMLYFDTHFNSLPAILRNFDRMSMAHGVEIRTPFLDWRLVSLAFSLPMKAKLGKGTTKLILRHAMKGLLPEAIRTRSSKVGFVHIKSPEHTPHFPFLQETIHSRAFRESHFFDGKRISMNFEKALKSGDWSKTRWPESHVMLTRLVHLMKS
ncbi:MAG: asparagine synthase [Desulfamplus sp.]|nr:asparagine synthase [Desulfamplus sp.]